MIDCEEVKGYVWAIVVLLWNCLCQKQEGEPHVLVNLSPLGFSSVEAVEILNRSGVGANLQDEGWVLIPCNIMPKDELLNAIRGELEYRLFS